LYKIKKISNKDSRQSKSRQFGGRKQKQNTLLNKNKALNVAYTGCRKKCKRRKKRRGQELWQRRKSDFSLCFFFIFSLVWSGYRLFFLHTDGNHTIFNIIRFIFTRFNIPYKHISTIDFITEFQRIVTRENGFGKSTSAGEREALDRTRSIFLSSLQTKGHIPCGLSLCNKNRNPQGPVTHKGKSKTGWAVLKFFKKYISLKNIGHAQSMEIFIKKIGRAPPG
jgi:hypothetical protein